MPLYIWHNTNFLFIKIMLFLSDHMYLQVHIFPNILHTRRTLATKLINTNIS